MYNILAITLKYVFIIIIYLFIFSIIRMIYLDIRGMRGVVLENAAYLKLINRGDTLSFKTKEYYTIDDGLFIGRNRGNDIVLKDPFVSKKHFEIIKVENDYFLGDLASANGTYLNKEKIDDIVKLENGDILKVGQIQFLFVNRK